jgi:hypothetical protein
MKKSTARNIVLTFLVAASLGSYIYLNTVEPCCTQEDSPLNKLEWKAEGIEENLDDHPQGLKLPDLMLIEKVIEIGKRFIPAS